MNSQQKTCETCSQDFTVYPEDLAMYGKFDVPAPKQCRECRIRHLFAFWLFGRFRKTTSDLSGKSIITTFPENTPYPIYARDEWFSDVWDPMEYGAEYDASRSFFEQFNDLEVKVPHPHQSGTKNTRCEWADDVWSSKDCYLCKSLLGCENLSYGYRTLRCKNSIDLTYGFDMELSYDCVNCFKCYGTKHSIHSRDCIDSAFLYDCRNCQNCFLSWNLRNKEYHILNQPYSKKEYEAKMKEFDISSWHNVQKLKKQFREKIAREAIHRQHFNTQVTNSTGNFLTECKNCFDCAFIENSENCRYVWRAFDSKDCIDAVSNIGEKSALSVMCIGIYDSLGASHCSSSRYVFYSSYCEDCEYCFGCVGLRKKKYCVFNKQYSKEEYEKLTAQIKVKMQERGEWGRFFPLSMARFGYNLTNAQFLFPETKERILELGGLWHELPDETKEGMNAEELPARIDEVSDDITTQPLICPETKEKFNIAPHELEFYRTHRIPPPRRHFDWRTLDRFQFLDRAIRPREGICHFCKKNIIHYFPKEWGYEKIACVECYQREVI